MGQHAGSREGMKPNLAADHSSQRSLTPMFAAVREGERELAVIGVLLAYVAVWTLYGVLSKGSQDVHFDMAEMVAWSRELALGYPKHPPFGAWIAAAWFAIFPVTDWAFYLLAMTVAGLALWLAWRLFGDFLDGEKRIVALALLTLVPFYNFHALKYNANTVLLPLWAATTLCFIRSFEMRSVGWAALAGLCAAAAMLGKYWSAFLVFGLAFVALIDPRRGLYFRSWAPWVTIAVGALALAPHVAWLVAQDFAPFSYAIAGHVRSPAAAAVSVVTYLSGAAGYVALPVLLVLVAVGLHRDVLGDILWPPERPRRFMAAAFWTPLFLPALVAPLLGSKITSLWTMSAWTLLPVVLLSSPLVSLSHRAVVAIIAVAVAVPLLMTAAAPAIAIYVHRVDAVTPAAAQSRLLAERVAQEWRKVTDQPLRLIGGNGELVYGLAFYSPGRPSAFPDFDLSTAPWVNPARIILQGIAIVCYASDPTCLATAEALGLTGRRIEVRIAREHFGEIGQAGDYVIMIVPPRP
jgi:4-amino-4-deoxy-L-arabinose transferase-like glycosyltransferase